MRDQVLNILHTESSTGWGGQENRTLNEMIGLQALGHNVSVLGRPGARLLERAEEAGFTTYSVNMRSALDIPAFCKMRALIKRLRPDIINCHSSRDTQLMGMAAHSLGHRRPRIVRTRHLALPITSRFTYNTLPDRVITVSRFVAKQLLQAGVLSTQLRTVPTGIDLGRYSTGSNTGSIRQELALSQEDLLIGTVAILRRKKGHADLLNAVPEVLNRFPSAHFIIAGDGPMYETLREQVRSQDLAGHVHLLGLRRDVVNVLSSLDLFVLPTHQEALGTAFIEAAAMGLASIGTNVDGVPEVIQDGVTGLLVPPQDSASLAQAICTLLQNASLRLEMGRNALSRISEHYSRQAMANGMLEAYYELLAK